MIDLLFAPLLAAVLFLALVVFVRARIYKCPECYHRSDYDHIAEVAESAPYCPYCGSHTVNVGRRWQMWLQSVGFDTDYTVITPDRDDRDDGGSQTDENQDPPAGRGSE